MPNPADAQDAVLALMSARTGHFPLESGHHGELWLELDALFWDPAALEPFALRLADLIRPHAPDVVCGPLVGGAYLGQVVATRLGVRFCHAERASTGDGGLYAATYRLPDALAPRLAGLRVAVVDDVVNAGSAVRATLAALAQAGARPVALGALLALGATPAAVAASAGLPLETVATRENEIWEPAHCPRCANGEPLQTP
jgi:orotate phosphoribosyltransferase